MPVMTRGKYKKIWEEFRNNPEAFCDICSKSFPSAYFLQVHNETFCHICPKSLPSAYFLEVHNRVFHQSKTFPAKFLDKQKQIEETVAAQIEIAQRQNLEEFRSDVAQRHQPQVAQRQLQVAQRQPKVLPSSNAKTKIGKF